MVGLVICYHHPSWPQRSLFTRNNGSALFRPDGRAGGLDLAGWEGFVRRVGFIAILCVASIGLAANAAEEHSGRLMGYSAQGSQAERQWEEKFQAIPEPDNMRAYMKRLSATLIMWARPMTKANAEWILSKFKEFGLDAPH